MLQPLTLANGIVGNRITTLSDDSQLTKLCLEDQSLSQLGIAEPTVERQDNGEEYGE